MTVVARTFALAVALSAALAAPAGADTVVSGSLTAQVSRDPWQLQFVQRDGSQLGELAGADAGPYGTLSFGLGPTPTMGGQADQPAGPLWYHATRVVTLARTGAGLTAQVATNDPAGRMLTVSVTPSGDGVIAVHATVTPSAIAPGVTQMADAFASSSDEHFSGFGGRENALDQAGNTVQTWAEEGAWIPADRPFIPPFIEPWTYSVRDDGSYAPMPWMVSSHGYGFLLDDPELSVFRLRSDRPDAWAVQAYATHLDYRVFAGPAPLDVVRRFSAAIGRQPAPAAPWVLGPWWQPTGADAASLPQRFRKQDVPGSLVQTYTHYLPCGSHVGNTAAEHAQTTALHAAGYAVTTYFNPMICLQYDPVYSQAQQAGALLQNQAGQPYVLRYNQYVVAEVDFTAKAGQELYKRLLADAVTNGYDGWMEDFGEYTPPDAVGHDGTPGSALHNLYPRLYHCTAFQMTSSQARPVIEFDRSGYTGSAPCSPVMWGGDPTTDWSFDGLPGATTMGLNYGYSGVGIYGSDVGGFFSIRAPPTTPELLARWLELGAFSGVMRTESEGFSAPGSGPRAQIWDPAVQPIWRMYAKLRTQMYPYSAATADAYRASGVPMMEALGLAYPREPASWAGPARYLFGPNLLVAPITDPGARSDAVPLPGGGWRYLWQAVAYDASDGSFHLRSAPAFAGGTTARVAAPLEQLPVFVREGTLLALLPPDVATLAPYGSATVRLADRAGRLHLLAWPRGVSRATALGTRLLSRLTSKRWSLAVSGSPPRSLAVEAGLAGRPTQVRWRGRALRRRRWSYRAGVLRVTVAGNGELVARVARTPRRAGRAGRAG